MADVLKKYFRVISYSSHYCIEMGVSVNSNFCERFN